MVKSSAGIKKGRVLLEEQLTDPQQARTAKIRTEYLTRKERPVHDTGSNLGDASEVRRHILGMSLFPNIYNRAFLLRQG